jgi:prepilin-type N-terminal cleavage/methylation domain-containing protein
VNLLSSEPIVQDIVMAQKTGFTIIELSIAIALIGILSAIALPDIAVWMASYRLKGAVRMVRSNLYNAKMLSAKKARQCKVIVDTEENTCIIQEGDKSSGSKNWTDIESRSFSDYSGVTAEASANPIFNPRGTVSPTASIYLTDSNGVSIKITISIAGRIKVN